MRRRTVRRSPDYLAKKPFTLDIDLLADWRSYADEPALPQSDRDWRCFGTVMHNGVTGALAWKGAGYGLSVRAKR